MGNDNTPYQEKEEAGCLGLAVSFYIPFVGIILYFVQKDSVSNPRAYLIAAMLPIIICLIMGALH